MLVTMTYRPSGRFKGRPGEETLLMNSSGGLVERTQIGSPQEAYPWILSGVALLSIIAAPILIWFIVTDEGRNINPLYVGGRILWVQIEEPFLVPAIHYQNPSVTGELLNWQIAPKNPENVLAMIYRHLGIDPAIAFVDFAGRPRTILEERSPIREVI